MGTSDKCMVSMSVMQKNFALFVLFAASAPAADLSSSRLLRQPNVSARQIAFIYAGDVWTANRSGTEPRRLTHTPEAESSPASLPMDARSPSRAMATFTSCRPAEAASGGSPGTRSSTAPWDGLPMAGN